MIAVLKDATEYFTAVMSDAPATVQPNYMASWNGDGGPAAVTGPLTGVTAKTIIDGENKKPPRTVEELRIYNADSASVTVTLAKVADGVSYTLFVTAIPAKGSLRWSKDGIEVIPNGA